LNPNPDEVDVRLPEDSDARLGVLQSSLMSVSPPAADLMSVALLDAAGVDGAMDDVEDRGNGGDGCDDVPGVTLPDDACFVVSCCLLPVHPQFTPYPARYIQYVYTPHLKKKFYLTHDGNL